MSICFERRIRLVRQYLLEDGKTFGARFGVKASAVSMWELGKREAPYKVLQFVLGADIKICDKCDGKGYIN